MKVLFVCTGNICRSPLAEGVLRSKYVELAIDAYIDSCGFEAYHFGDRPDHRAQKVARTNGIDISNHSARRFIVEDFDRFDRIFVMDSYHYQAVMSIARNDQDREKIDFVRNAVYPGRNLPVKDPYYDDFYAFEEVFEQLDEACEKIAEIAVTFNKS